MKNCNCIGIGSNSYGQLGAEWLISHWQEEEFFDVIGTRNFEIQNISCGAFFVLMHIVDARKRHHLISRGCNQYGQLGCGFLSEQQSNFVQVKIESLLKSHSFEAEAENIPIVKEICCSSNCFYAIIEEFAPTHEIKVYQTRPQKRSKQPEEMNLKPLLNPAEIPIQLFAGSSAECCFIKTNQNRIFAVGVNRFGELGVPVQGEAIDEPVLIPPLPDNKKIKEISCGYGHSLFLSEDGHLYSAGNNNFGQLGIPGLPSQDAFKEVEFFPKNDLRVEQITCAFNSSVVVAVDNELNNALFFFGMNAFRLIDDHDSTLKAVPTPTLLTNLNFSGNVKQIAAGLDFVTFVCESHKNRVFYVGNSPFEESELALCQQSNRCKEFGYQINQQSLQFDDKVVNKIACGTCFWVANSKYEDCTSMKNVWEMQKKMGTVQKTSFFSDCMLICQQ